MICLSDTKCDFNTLNQVNLSSNNEGAVPTWPWSCSSVIVQLLLSLWEMRTMSKSGLWLTVNAIFLLNLLNYSSTQMLNVWFKFHCGVKRQHQTLSLSKYSFMDWHMRMWSAPQIPHWWRTKCYLMNISAVSEKWRSDECFYEPLSSLLIQVCRDFIWTDVNSQHIAEGNENAELYRYIHNWSTLLLLAKTSNFQAVCGDEPHETTERRKRGKLRSWIVGISHSAADKSSSVYSSSTAVFQSVSAVQWARQLQAALRNVFIVSC